MLCCRFKQGLHFFKYRYLDMHTSLCLTGPVIPEFLVSLHHIYLELLVLVGHEPEL